MSNVEYEHTYKKFQEVPSSTPNNLIVSSRKSIHNRSVSPITKHSHNAEPRGSPKEHGHRKSRAKSELHSASNSESDSDEEDDSRKSYSQRSTDTSKNYSSRKRIQTGSTINDRERVDKGGDMWNLNSICFYLIFFALSIPAGLIYVLTTSEDTLLTTNAVSIAELQGYFPLQSEDIWSALESGIKEVKHFNKPSVFLLLYEDEAEETLNNILKNISKYAVCTLNENCEIQPIVLTSASLGTERAMIDYGYVIDKYKSQLEEKTVMIVKNLDNVPGEVAQAFHSMCDEYTPLVGKTVFFFTLKMENLKTSGKRDLQVVEEVLRTNWSDLDDDIFYPLFTRISSMVLRVVPEKM